MITVNKKQITVIENDFSDVLSLTHCNQKINPIKRQNHCNHYTKKTRGQSIAEYTVFITVMVMALLAMQVYLKRGVQGKIKDMADSISPGLYNPNTTTSNYNTTRSRLYTSTYARGVSNTTVLSDSTNRTGYDSVEAEGVYY